MARYSPITDGEMNEDFEKAKLVISQIDKQLWYAHYWRIHKDLKSGSKIICTLILLINQVVSSQSALELFEKGNEQYKLEQYEDAIQTYNQIEQLNVTSSSLYYNLGNCYYKLNRVAPSIYNYEKALLIDSSNEDAENNLVFAKD